MGRLLVRYHSVSHWIERLIAKMRYSFITAWWTAVPVEPVWQAITRVEDWPRWWRGVKKVKKVRRRKRKRNNGKRKESER